MKTGKNAAFIQLSYRITFARVAFVALILRATGKLESRADEFTEEGGASFE